MDSQGAGMSPAGGTVSVPSGDGFDSGSTSFETGVTEVHEVYPQTPQVNPQDPSIGDEDSEKIMAIPGTAHDKLTGLADIEDEEIQTDAGIKEKPQITGEEKKSLEVPEAKDMKEPTFEQKVIMLQAEALKFLAKSMDSKINDKEKEELLKKLKALLEELEESENSNKASLMGAVFRVIFLLFDTAEKGTKQLEKEVKRAQN